MFIDKDFQFRVNISNDFYVKKTDATACLSREGAKAIGKQKMAFREYGLTVDQFLRSALNGYTFCNLFEYDPNQLYWFETSAGKHYQSYPVYKDGPNKGCMKLLCKSDRFFRGAQTVFVDIDLTRFENIEDYLNSLTIPPTCAYMSYSDKLEKGGITSRRFRMVYVFNRVLNKDELSIISRCITDSIVRDTGEPMKDECGNRPSQYFNGVYGNEECYASYYIYSRLEFPEDLPHDSTPQQALSGQNTSQPTVEFDPRLLHDMGTMDYEKFMRHNSRRYCYFYRTERAEWTDGLYQLTDENYLQLWWVRERITDGNHRRRTLFKRACLRRLINPNVDADTLLFNMYIDLNKFIDNSDHIITLDTLIRRTKRAMLMTDEELRDYCRYEVDYWRDHRPKFIMQPQAPKSQAFINDISKRIHYGELDQSYDRARSVQDNAAALGESLATLYRYCHARWIDTNPGKGQTYREAREAKKQAKADKKAKFMLLYCPDLSAAKNREFMLQNGLELSEGTIRNWSKGYITEDMIAAPTTSASEGPAIDFEPIKFNVPSFSGAWWNVWGDSQQYAEMEAKWREACRS